MDRRKRRTTQIPYSCLKKLMVYGTVIMLTSLLALASDKSKAQIISPLPDDHQATRSFVSRFMRRTKDPQKLKQLVVNKIASNWKNYSIYVVDFTSDFTMGINESVIYSAASVNKIPILIALYHDAQAGTVDLDTVITIQAQDIQHYGTGVLRYEEPGNQYSIKTLAQLMMKKSDNTAAHIVGNHILTLERIQKLVNSWGMTQTDMVNNKTSNRDIALLMRRLYQRDIVNDAYTQEVLSIMKDSDFEDRLPALLPAGITVYHKIGTGTGSVHDVGIVAAGKTVYYLGVFTNDITDEEQASALVAEISKVIFDFMR